MVVEFCQDMIQNMHQVCVIKKDLSKGLLRPSRANYGLELCIQECALYELLTLTHGGRAISSTCHVQVIKAFFDVFKPR